MNATDVMPLESPARRNFLRTSIQAGVGLTIAITLPLPGCVTGRDTQTSATASEFAPNAFVRVAPDSTVTVMIKHLEMGQGAYTGLITLVAEEMDARWDQMVGENAPADATKYNNLSWGKAQGVGGSSGLSNSYRQMREAGAAARYLLVSAAAEQWQVSRDSIRVQNGTILHPPTGRNAEFGEFVMSAARQSLPDNIPLKDSSQFVYIGKNVPRKDTGKTDGTAIFTQDMRLPDMVTAVIAHPPRFGAKVQQVNDSAALNVPGVLAVVTVPSGVAVVAKDFWQAQKARNLLQIQWDESAAFSQSSEQLLQQYHAAAKQTGMVAAARGDIGKGFAQASKIIEATYEFPYLAHATLEPLNCVVHIRPDGVDVWNGCQMQSGDQDTLAKLLGVSPQSVNIHTLYAGGSFGRRANPVADYVVETAQIAKAYGKPVPVKLQWARENDTRAGYYRPLYVHRLKAGLDKAGNILAWQHHIVGQSILKGTPFESMMVKNGIDGSSVEGASNLPYAIPNFQVELTTMDVGVPVLWWRSVGSTHTAYATEHFLDQLARAAGKDPVQYRLGLLQGHPRHAAVLKLAAEKAGWGRPLPNDTVLGVAVHESFHSYVAQVAQIKRQADGFRLEKIVCAVDCGVAVNPDVIRAQMEGGIGYGLSPALMSTITLSNGSVVQSNFHDYQVVRMKDMPTVDVHIMPSVEPPTGVGEPGTPVIAPAVANALLASTGKSYGKLPLAETFV